MLKRWTRFLPYVVVLWLAKRHCAVDVKPPYRLRYPYKNEAIGERINPYE